MSILLRAAPAHSPRLEHDHLRAHRPFKSQHEQSVCQIPDWCGTDAAWTTAARTDDEACIAIPSWFEHGRWAGRLGFAAHRTPGWPRSIGAWVAVTESVPVHEPPVALGLEPAAAGCHDAGSFLNGRCLSSAGEIAGMPRTCSTTALRLLPLRGASLGRSSATASSRF